MVISKEKAKELLQIMYKIRFAEEILVDPILKGEIKCPVHLYTGQEAIATGVCVNLEKKDYIFGNHRSHGHYLAKGGSLRKMFSEIYGKIDGCCKGRGGSMHLIDVENGIMGIAPIVAGTISLALGAALASYIRNDKRISVSFFGDGATGEGVLYESLNFAALKKLPILFVCENNLYSTHLPIKEIRSNPDIYKIAEPFGIKTFQTDGNDVLGIYELTKEIINYIRDGNGPVFIEFKTYRFRGHVGPDDNIQGTHTDIRPKEEIEYWKKRDPIIIYINKLKEYKILDDDEIKTIEEEMKAHVNNEFNEALKSDKPKSNELTKYVYVGENITI